MSDTPDYSARIHALERRIQARKQAIAREQCLLAKDELDLDYYRLEQSTGMLDDIEPTGGRAKWCKVTRSMVLAIQATRDATPELSFTEIGKAFGISRATACQINNGTYKGLDRIIGARAGVQTGRDGV